MTDLGTGGHRVAAAWPSRTVAAAADLNYFAGMNASHVRDLRAAMEGADALAEVLALDEENAGAFTDRDVAALDGE